MAPVYDESMRRSCKLAQDVSKGIVKLDPIKRLVPNAKCLEKRHLHFTWMVEYHWRLALLVSTLIAMTSVEFNHRWHLCICCMIVAYPATATAELLPRADFVYNLYPRPDPKRERLTQVELIIDKSNINKTFCRVTLTSSIEPNVHESGRQWTSRKRKVTRRQKKD
ncbi:hypothetical protein BGZ91_011222 [Linnemannia elongata]|nr:hypothetical protein BGZ91_011222 [Linnemannia elongata]KAG0080658.1 hypothetical protein BGZ90_011686 [Linnemannia elongata]